jgi:hypothetical protein
MKEHCEACERRKASSRKHYQKNRESRMDDVRKWRKKNPEKVSEINRRAYRKKKGLKV